MAGYENCKWCYGDGCNQCHIEKEKDIKKFEKDGPQPLFTAKLDSPSDIELLKDVFGKDALEKAFGPDGEGMQEIKQNAAIASLKQCLRAEFNKPEDEQ